MASHTYIHHVPGRLRVRSGLVKRNEKHAVSATTWLRSLPGVSSAEANTLTGSLTLRYDPGSTSGDALLSALKGAGYLSEHHPTEAGVSRTPSLSLNSELGVRVAKAAAVYALEKVIETSVVALVSAIL